MWNRAELKGQAKEALKRNYWKAVLVGLLCVIIGTSSGLELNLNSKDSGVEDNNSSFDFGFLEDTYNLEDELYRYNDSYDYGYDYDYDYDDYGMYEDFDGYDSFGEEEIFGFALRFIFVCIVISIIAGIIGILLSTFIFNPLEVGASRFFLKNLDKNAQVGELGFAFDTDYKNVTKTMFFRSLYTFLWTLLFVIPGVVKSYEYMMIPYLLAENPSLTKEQAFAISKQMMDGQKWNAFVLDLSFIGWHMLSTITLGLVSIFYLNPYIQHTYAALYQELSQQNGRPAFGVANQQMHYEQWGINEDAYPQKNTYELPVTGAMAYEQAEQENDNENF